MQTTIVYIIGALAAGYIIMTIWRKLNNQASCCSSGSGCSGCSSNKNCK